MKAQFLDWWRGRSLREQRLLLVMFALVAITLLWLGLYRPVENALSTARARHEQAVIGLGETRAAADALRAFRKAGVSGPRGPLAPFVTQWATDAGFANAAVAPQGDKRASVAIPSATPRALFAWIAGLEGQGVVVERFSARANSDRTLAVEAVLTGGA